jgi:hypothetical protein
MAARFIEDIKMKAIFWLGHRLPACAELTPVMSQSFERKLTLRERITLKLHLFICIQCQRYLKQLRMMHEALKLKAKTEANDGESAKPALSDDARKRLKEALKRK